MAALMLEEFRALIAEIAEVGPAEVADGDRFVEDLGMDSLRMLELMTALAERGVDAPEDVVFEGRSVKQAFEICRGALPWPQASTA